MKHTRLMFAAALASACAVAVPACAQEVSDHYYWRPAADDAAPRPWAIILPGGGGMEVFGDAEHYFRWAAWLNARGIDVLAVHYQAAGEHLADVQHERPDQMQARVVSHAMAYERALGRMDQRCRGIVLGWSFGGAGTLEIAAQGADHLPGLAGAVGFYPLVTFQPPGYAPQVPVLVLQGEVDDTTTPQQLDGLLAGAVDGEIHAVSFADAHHAFDVAGLTEPVTWNGGTFLYNATAATAAQQALDDQLAGWGMTGPGACALD